ncbi:MAG: ImmA/IrrE family metallo-endopeptidase [Gemmatimonadota bacterium]
MEEIARDTLNQRFPAGIKTPIDIDLIIERTPGMDLDLLPGIQSRFGVSGVVLWHPDEERFTIVVDADLADKRETIARFTAAEEFSHVVLHESVMKEIKTKEEAVELQASGQYKTLDRNARWLASALLMPPNQLRIDVEEVFERSRKIPEIATRVRKAIVIGLGQRYAVSASAMEYRMKNWPLECYDTIVQALEEGRSTL